MTAAVDIRRTNGHGAPSGGRVPPHDLPAEESLLGAMLLGRDALDTAIELCTADAFYKPAHGHLFAAMATLAGKAQAVDPITVCDELRRLDLLDAVGGPPAVVALQATTPATGNAARYAHIVDELARLRRLIAVAAEIAEIGYAVPDDVDLAVDQAEQLLQAVGDRRRTDTRLIKVDDAIDGWLTRLEERTDSDEKILGVRTGWADLDKMLCGLRAGQLVTVGARPAMGKSDWAANLALYAARQTAVVIVSLEMSADELVGRWMASDGRIQRAKLRAAELGPEEWTSVSASITRVGPLPLWVDDSPDSTLTSIAGSVRRAAKAARQPVGLLIVDYAQLVNPARKSENRQVDVSDITRGLKRMARTLKVPIVALAQLNRNLEHRADKRPTLSDLRESGGFEADSDTIVFLYREEVYNPDTLDKGIAELIVDKQRSGPRGVVKLDYDPSTGRFTSMRTYEELHPEEGPF